MTPTRRAQVVLETPDTNNAATTPTPNNLSGLDHLPSLDFPTSANAPNQATHHRRPDVSTSRRPPKDTP